MGRPRTTNKSIKDLPRGMRKVGSAWYWRPTCAGTRAVFDVLTKRGHKGSVGKTPKEAAAWWAENVSPLLHKMTPDEAIKGAMEEIFRAFEAAGAGPARIGRRDAPALPAKGCGGGASAGGKKEPIS